MTTTPYSERYHSEPDDPYRALLTTSDELGETILSLVEVVEILQDLHTEEQRKARVAGVPVELLLHVIDGAKRGREMSLPDRLETGLRELTRFVAGVDNCRLEYAVEAIWTAQAVAHPAVARGLIALIFGTEAANSLLWFEQTG